jgi:DNA-directed RNA polymerase specialized sigma subunit
MSNEYLNNKNLEKIILLFQKTKRDKKLYGFLDNDLKSRNLINEFIEKKFVESSNHFVDIQKNLAHAFYILSSNIVRYAKFSLIDQDDAVQEGVLVCFEKLDKFDPRVGKAFNYMTTCILNHFKQLYRSAKNYNELKKKYQDFTKDKGDFQG